MSNQTKRHAPQFGPVHHSLIIVAAASVWGLYWLPLRKVEQLGLTGAWAVLAFNLIPLLALVPLMVWRRERFRQYARLALAIGFFAGAGIACYALALLYTTVMRATLLYYLTPVWSTLIAMVVLRERVTWQRWLAITIGFVGLYMMLSGGDQTAETFNQGDVLGLMSGIFWGFGATLMRRNPEVSPYDTVSTQYVFGTLIAFAALLILGTSGAPTPTLNDWLRATPLTFLFCIGIFLPTMLAIFWSASKLSPGRVGILMMSEVVVAGISASLIAGEHLNNRELIGAGLILTAGVVEVLGPSMISKSHDPG